MKMAQKTKNIMDKTAQGPTAEPLAPEAIVGVAFGTVLAVVEADLTPEDGAVLKDDEPGEAAVVAERAFVVAGGASVVTGDACTGMSTIVVVLVTASGKLGTGPL